MKRDSVFVNGNTILHDFKLSPVTMPAHGPELRAEVRAFLKEELKAASPVSRAKSWFGSDPAFSRKLGERGWIGMTWPKAYGGHERSAIDRYIVIEELLGLVTVLRRSLISLCHLCFERQRADAAQI